MLCLPQILYLFRTLPIPLKNNHLKALRNILKQYLWKSKCPRCSRTLLTKHRTVVGMGNIDLKDYYHSSLLTQPRHWFSPSSDILWSQIEKTLSPGGELRTFFFDWYVEIISLTTIPTPNPSFPDGLEGLEEHPTFSIFTNYYIPASHNLRKSISKLKPYSLATERYHLNHRSLLSQEN